MNVKKTFVIILLFLLLFSTVTFVSADDDKSYSIEQAIIDLTIGNDGLLHVKESYDYSFDGSFNGVYRDIPLKSGESIENITVTADGAYAVCEVSESDGQKHLKIYLYSDAAHTQGVKDCDVTVHISYDMKGVVTLFNDVGALQYKLCGEDWDVPIENLKCAIHMPGDSGNEYYLNPQEYNQSSSMQGNTINTYSSEIPDGNFYEALVLMPTSDFNEAPYAKHVNEDGREMIMQNLKDSVEGREFWSTIYTLLGFLALLGPIGAVIVYLRHGKEPEVNYNGVYERDLPSNDAPEVVNALIENKSGIGTPNLKGFEASIMNLIDRKVLKLDVKKDPETFVEELNLVFNGKSGLSSSEQIVYDTLFRFSHDNVLNLSRLNGQLSNEDNAKWFVEQIDNWKEVVKAEINLPKYFDDTGTSNIVAIGFGGLILGVILFILGILCDLDAGIFTLAGGAFLVIFSIATFLINDDVFGSWTYEGREYYLKWENLKKFLKDNSLIKEYPPESIIVWNKYLIYGTALGVADKVYESMKLEMPLIEDDDDYRYGLYRYHYYGGYGMMNAAFMTGHETANPSSDIDDFGSVGGGSGGGGGGAF